MASPTIKEETRETPTLRDPFGTLREMQRAMRVFLEPFPMGRFEVDVPPAINLKEQDGGYVLECALPGYKKDDVNVELSGNAVTISGTYAEEKRDEKARFHRHEMRQGSFLRTIELPAEIDAEKVAATFDNGMLKLTLPASPGTAKKKIPIGG